MFSRDHLALTCGTLLLLLGACCGTFGRAFGEDLRLVARSGQIWEVPSTTLGEPPKSALLGTITSFSMNNDGQVAFIGQSSQGQAVWSEVVGDTAIAISGMSAIGLPAGSTYSSFSANGIISLPPWVRLDDEGRTIFGGLFAGPPNSSIWNAAGFWARQGDAVTLIAAETMPAPSSAPVMYFRQFGSNHSSEVDGNPSLSISATGGQYFAVEARLAVNNSPNTSPSSLSYWAMGPSGPRLVHEVQYLPTTGLSPEFVINRSGSAAYEAYNKTTGLTLVREQGGVPTTVVDQTTIIPGFGSTGRVVNANYLKLNDSGTLGFVGIAASGPSDEGLFLADATGHIRTVAIEGGAVPGSEEPRFFGSSGGNAFIFRALGPHDEAVFQANEMTLNPFALYQTLWIDRNGSLSRLLSEGDNLPGLTPDQTIKGGGSIGLFGRVEVNSQGLVVLTAGFQGATASGRGIWAIRPGDAEFTPIAIDGQSVSMPDGSQGTLTSLTYGEVNDRGQILVKGKYDGGDVLFISNAVATLSDFDGDLIIDADDLNAWKFGFGGEPSLAVGDGNGDGVVDGADFLRWQREASVSQSPPVETAGVPEPSSLTLLAVATLVSRFSRCRNRIRD